MKQRMAYLILFLILFIFYGSPWENKKQQKLSNDIEQTIQCLQSHLGKPHASKSKHGLDCSALVKTCYKSVEIELPRDSRSQFEIGRKVKEREAQKGDLIFFTGSNAASPRVGHSGIITGINNDDIQFIHATLNKGVIESSLSEAYYRKRYKGIKRIIE